MSTAKKLQNKLFGGAAAQANPSGTSPSIAFRITSSLSETLVDPFIGDQPSPPATDSPHAGSGTSTPVATPQNGQQQPQHEALKINIPTAGGTPREKEK